MTPRRSKKKTAPIKAPNKLTRTPKKTSRKAVKTSVPRKAPSKRATRKTSSQTTKTITQHRRTEKKKARNAKMPDTSKIVPDTSILIEGAISKQLSAAQLTIKEIIIPEAVLSELEAQANRRKDTGYLGLDEIENIKNLADTQGFTMRFAGERPSEFEIKFAKSGEIDSLIRQVAEENNAVLYTADVVQGKVARAKGIPVILHHRNYEQPQMDIESFFDKETMSIHIKENTPVFAKKGKPGEWKFITVRKNVVQRREVELWAKQIIEAAYTRHDGFVEIERKGSTILQVGHYRIVITRPPFADGNEITAVRPVKRLSLEEYKLSDKLKERIDKQAEGILIAGAPGHGKSTFAQALAEHYSLQQKIIKTVEAPRDMVLADEITQYAISHGSAEEVHDILLLSRPDYTFFDEMRNTEDFKLFADMRLSGVGMIGVMHATKTIDAIQRFLGRIELGVIPHVIDTVVFIQNGSVASIYSISMTVKVPSGMTEADLARPVVEVHDFESAKLVFEIYTYGEQTVVIPVSGETQAKSVHKFAQAGLQKYFERHARNPQVKVMSDNKLLVMVDEGDIARIIGKGGEHIRKIEEDLGMSVEIRGREASRGDERIIGKEQKGKSIPFGVQETKTNLLLDVGRENSNRSLNIYVDNDFLMTAHASKKGVIKLTKRNKMVKLILEGLDNDTVRLFKA